MINDRLYLIKQQAEIENLKAGDEIIEFEK